MPKPKKPESPWQPTPVTLIPSPAPVFSTSNVLQKQRASTRIIADHMKRSGLTSIAAAYFADTEAFDNFIFTGDEDPQFGKRHECSAEHTASQVFAQRRKHMAFLQARSTGATNREFDQVLISFQRKKSTGYSFFPHHAFFDHA